MKRLLLLFAALIGFSGIVNAQPFYDSEDEIYLYRDETGKIYPFNFDGRKATMFGFQGSSGAELAIKQDPNYFEKRVFSVDYDLKYNENMSTSSKIVYTYTFRWGYYKENIGYEHYCFSRDRKTMTLIANDGNLRRNAVRILKEDILPHRRERSMNNGVLYE